MLRRSDDVHSDEGRVFWMAVAAELAAVTAGAVRPTVRDVLAAAVRRARWAHAILRALRMAQYSTCHSGEASRDGTAHISPSPLMTHHQRAHT